MNFPQSLESKFKDDSVTPRGSVCLDRGDVYTLIGWLVSLTRCEVHARYGPNGEKVRDKVVSALRDRLPCLVRGKVVRYISNDT